MPTLKTATITGLVRADDLDVIRTISNIPTGQTLTDAWLTVNDTSPPNTHLFQKHITGTLVAGQGQIEDTGAGDGIAVVRFELTSGPTGDTTKLNAETQYAYDIQVKTSGAKIYTPESGLPPLGGITASEQVTTEIT